MLLNGDFSEQVTLPSFSLSFVWQPVLHQGFQSWSHVTVHWKAPWGEKVLPRNIPSMAARIISAFL